MKTALLDESYDTRLEKICPAYLEGHKNISKRIHWGIDKLFELLDANGRSNDRQAAPATPEDMASSDATGGKTKPAGADTG